MTQKVFGLWCKEFVKWLKMYKTVILKVPENQPVLLYTDGHNSRDENALTTLQDAHVRVVFLPPHTSHITQPLDDAPYRSFKQTLRRYYKEKVAEESCRSPTDDILTMTPQTNTPTLTKYRDNLIGCIHDAWGVASNRTFIKRAWKNTGLWPWNPDMVCANPEKVPQWSVDEEKVTHKHGDSTGMIVGDKVREAETKRIERDAHKARVKMYKQMKDHLDRTTDHHNPIVINLDQSDSSESSDAVSADSE